MTHDTIEQAVLFPELSKKPIIASFDQAHASSDGGAMLLKACDQRLGLSQLLAGCLSDRRDPAKITHQYQELLAQRLYSIACGYADGNDAARLSDDPIFKLLADRDPVKGAALASQPTLSRFENAISAAELLNMSRGLAECVIERHRQRLKGKAEYITIDLDPTEDPTHGAQQLSFFNTAYDSHCYLPMAGFLSFNGEPDQYLFGYVLRPGNVTGKHGCIAILKRLLPALRAAFPKTETRIRLDAGFTGDDLYRYFEKEGLKYVVCMAKNAVLKRLAEPMMVPLRKAQAEGRAPKITFAKGHYKAGKWTRSRRVIIKAGLVLHPGREPKDNPRFLITNMKGRPKRLYRQVYCGRGDAENRIKELKYGLAIDRTSCTSFKANQFRTLLTAAAFILFQELRLHAAGTGCGRAQTSTLRLRLLKLSTWIEVSVRRIVIHMPNTTAYADDWRRIALSIGAVPT